MKKALFILSFGLLTNGIQSQTNLNFENWTGNEPNGWESSNAQTTQGGGAQTVFKETVSPGQGSSSVKMVTGSCPTCPDFSIFGPFGGFTTPLPDPLGGSIESVSSINQRPLSVDFKYKSNPIGNDAGGFNVELTKYNSSTGESDVIGEGYFEAGIPVASWTNMNIPIIYYSNLVPDTITFWATSSIGSIPDLTSLNIPYVFPVPTPVAGSEFYLDAIHINFPSCDGFGISVTGTNESAPLAADGTANVTPNGGTAPYSYEWSNLATTASISSLPSGLYSVSVTDANGCLKVGNYNVLPASCDGFSVSVSGTVASSFTAQDGSASATVTGGTAPYTYLWNTGDETASISGLQLGAYTVAVTDASGNCFAWGYFPSDLNTSGIENLDLETTIVVYPNPSKGVFTVNSEKAISVIQVYDLKGSKVFEKQLNAKTSKLDLSNLNEGVYHLKIVSDQNSISSREIILKY